MYVRTLSVQACYVYCSGGLSSHEAGRPVKLLHGATTQSRAPTRGAQPAPHTLSFFDLAGGPTISIVSTAAAVPYGYPGPIRALFT